MMFVLGVFRLKRGVKSMSKSFNYEPWFNDAKEKYLKLEIGKTFTLKALSGGIRYRPAEPAAPEQIGMEI